MTERKWLYRPGESAAEPSASQLQQFLNLTEQYAQVYPEARTLVLSDNKDIVFFAQLSEDMSTRHKTHVFMWNCDHYIAVAPDDGYDMLTKYVDYLDVVSRAYENLEEDDTE